MDDLLSGCSVEGCRKIPSFGYEGERATRCARHRQEGMENVLSRRCEAEGCRTQPSFGYEGERASRCFHHRE
jgi:hypothetical protein